MHCFGSTLEKVDTKEFFWVQVYYLSLKFQRKNSVIKPMPHTLTNWSISFVVKSLQYQRQQLVEQKLLSEASAVQNFWFLFVLFFILYENYICTQR